MRIRKYLRVAIAVLLAILTACAVILVPSAETAKGEITGDGVRLRSDANTDSVTLRYFSAGDTVTILKTVTGTEAETGNGKTWYQVSDGSLTGYVYGAYLRLIELPEPVETPSFEEQLKAFPVDYQTNLKKLHEAYPNWVFIADRISNTKYKTFSALVDAEAAYPMKCVSVSDPNSLKSMGNGWYDWESGKYKENPTGWNGASRETIAYYMDPRNFLDNQNIFMFLQFEYDAASQNIGGVRKIIKGSFMDDSIAHGKNYFDENNEYGSYAEVIMAAAKVSGVSPYILASTIIQEQGMKGTSSLISGTYEGYGNAYKGHYNFFNCGASGSNVILNGLKYAKIQLWDSRAKSIFGGAELLGASYLLNGQDTYYYKDFDVKMKKGYLFQYAQAVYDAKSSGAKLRSVYLDDAESSPVFKIPVFAGMGDLHKEPAKNKSVNNYYLNSLAFAAKTSGNTISPTFDRYNFNYTLAVTGDQVLNYTLPTGATCNAALTYSLKQGSNTVSFKVTAQTGYSNTYKLTVNAEKACKLTLQNGKSTATTVKRGDVNGDNRISVADLAAIKLHLLGKKKLSGNAFTGADVTGDKAISIADLAAVKLHLLGKKLIK